MSRLISGFPEHGSSGDSPLHRHDARVKVVVALSLIVGITLTPTGAWVANAALWALVASLAAVGRLGVWRVARRGGIVLPFALAAATLLFTTPGNPLLTFAGLTVTASGAFRFATILLKSWLAVQVALILSMTTPFTDLLWALNCLHVPSTLVAIISFMYRYLFTLQDEAARLARARTARSGVLSGQRSGGGMAWRAQVAGGMVGNLFLRSYERSERVVAAMLARGYSGEMRTLDPPPLTWRAIGLGTIPVAVTLVIELVAALT
jgi:cobalt/nickel transport system permease protein